MDGPLIGKRATHLPLPLYLLCSPVFVDTHYRLSFVAEVVAVVTVVLSLPSIVDSTSSIIPDNHHFGADSAPAINHH